MCHITHKRNATGQIAYIYSMDLKNRKMAADVEGNRKKKSHKKCGK